MSFLYILAVFPCMNGFPTVFFFFFKKDYIVLLYYILFSKHALLQIKGIVICAWSHKSLETSHYFCPAVVSRSFAVNIIVCPTGKSWLLQVRFELTTSALLCRLLSYKYRALTYCATGAAFVAHQRWDPVNHLMVRTIITHILDTPLHHSYCYYLQVPHTHRLHHSGLCYRFFLHPAWLSILKEQ